MGLRYLVAGVVVWATASGVFGQAGQVGAMPGVTVGTMPAGSGVRPVGTQLPRAVPDVGKPIGGGGLPGTIPPISPGVSGMPSRPPGEVIDLKNVVAPYPNMPKELTFWEKLEIKWFSLFAPEPVPRAPNYTPGIARRNKERREQRQRLWDRE